MRYDVDLSRSCQLLLTDCQTTTSLLFLVDGSSVRLPPMHVCGREASAAALQRLLTSSLHTWLEVQYNGVGRPVLRTHQAALLPAYGVIVSSRFA